MEYAESTLSEAEFISAICHGSDSALLLDLNNEYDSERNHDHSSWDTIRHFPLDRVKEIHLAGFRDKGTHVINTHNHPVHPDVWQLLHRLLPYCITIKTPLT